MKTKNPALGQKIFETAGSYSGSDSMSVQGTVNKTFILFALLMISATWVWNMLAQPAAPVLEEIRVNGDNIATAMGLMAVGGIVGFIVAMVTIFKMKWSGITAPIYAVCQGLLLGGISAVFERQYPGLVIQAVGLTLATLFCLLVAYKTGFVTVTHKFRLGVAIATGAICLFYLVNLVLGFFGKSIPILESTGPWGIALSLFIVGIAALNLVLDFDLIDQLAQRGSPKYMEWYGGFALMVTLIWLYMEILRLLAKFRSNRN